MGGYSARAVLSGSRGGLHGVARGAPDARVATRPEWQFVADRRWRHDISCHGSALTASDGRSRSARAASAASVGATPALAVFVQMLPTSVTAKARLPVMPGFAATAVA